jgi:hypothetical protein
MNFFSWCLKRPFLGAVIFGLATYSLLGMIKALPPYSESKEDMLEALALPGAFIAGLVYPQGPHSDGGWVILWPLWVVMANMLVYILIWYVCLRVLRLFWPREQR